MAWLHALPLWWRFRVAGWCTRQECSRVGRFYFVPPHLPALAFYLLPSAHALYYRHPPRHTSTGRPGHASLRQGGVLPLSTLCSGLRSAARLFPLCQKQQRLLPFRRRAGSQGSSRLSFNIGTQAPFVCAIVSVVLCLLSMMQRAALTAVLKMALLLGWSCLPLQGTPCP